MVTIKDFNPELIASMSEQHQQILVDFANSFIESFGSLLPAEEVLARINKLKYIGFERSENVDERIGEADAEFISSSRKIIISQRHLDSEPNVIKSLLYHELIHAISYHPEVNLDSVQNQLATYRTGLDRQEVDFDPEYDGPGFAEGPLLEEIMTEYYNTILLKKEGIDFNGKSVIKRYCFSQDLVDYHGTGYYSMAALGQIYDFIFGKEIFEAKFIDGNNFRQNFNALFEDTEVFSDLFTTEDFKVPCYSKFVAQRGTIPRYRTACQMFVEIFKIRHRDDIKTIDDLLQNEEFDQFLSMLVKTKNSFEEEPIVNEELFMLTKELEADLVRELFGEETKEEVADEEIEVAIFLALEKIHKEDHDVDLSKVKYATFFDKHFKGLYLTVGEEQYIIDLDTLGQGIQLTKLERFADQGFSREDIEHYSSEYGMDISDAEFGTIINPITKATFIVKDGKLFNHNGEEITLGKFNNYSTAVPEEGAPAK